MAGFPRAVSLAVFRVHIENGLSVAVGVGLTGLVVAPLGFQAVVAAGTGALCVSVSDRPDPLRQKLWVMGLAMLAACFFTSLSSFAQFSAPELVVLCYGQWRNRELRCRITNVNGIPKSNV